jgi:hypothetical protein
MAHMQGQWLRQWLYILMEPTPHIKVKLGRAKRIICVGIAFPHAGSLCAVAKPFGEVHKERTLMPPSNPTELDKTSSLHRLQVCSL